jgi:hypothetical protein
MGNIDERLRIASMYKNNPDILQKHVEERNKIANELNERVIRIMEASPMYGKVDENGIMTFDFDVTTKEILRQLHDENDQHLRKLFPDLYKLSDYEKEN